MVCGHLGRPKGVVNPTMSLSSVAEWFAKTFGTNPPEKIQLGDFSAWKLSEALFVLENLRFYPGEEANDEVFSKQLASLAQLYIDDAFAVSHRAAASNVGVTKFLPSVAGIQLQKEVEGLSKVLENPQRPLVAIVGGAKLETKLPLVSKMHHFADYVLVGGKLVQETQEILKVQHEALEPSASGQKSILLVAETDEKGLDISPNSAENFAQVIANGKTIVWNGPVGKTSGDERGEEGTRKIAQAMIATSAYTVVGGGDSLEFLEREKMLEKFRFVSTGGGAMLSFLSGESLPALLVLSV
jgi:phosphoglycerate kinase